MNKNRKWPSVLLGAVLNFRNMCRRWFDDNFTPFQPSPPLVPRWTQLPWNPFSLRTAPTTRSGPMITTTGFCSPSLSRALPTYRRWVYHYADMLSFPIFSSFCLHFIIFRPPFQLIPSIQPLASPSSGYFFYYSLLGNDIANQPFHDLISPNFPPERASTHISSSVQALQAFFNRQSGLQVQSTPPNWILSILMIRSIGNEENFCL